MAYLSTHIESWNHRLSGCALVVSGPPPLLYCPQGQGSRLSWHHDATWRYYRVALLFSFIFLPFFCSLFPSFPFSSSPSYDLHGCLTWENLISSCSTTSQVLSLRCPPWCFMLEALWCALCPCQGESAWGDQTYILKKEIWQKQRKEQNKQKSSKQRMIGKRFGISYKVKHILIIWPRNSTPRYLFKKNEN